MSQATVIFHYKDKNTIIQCNTKEKMRNICERFKSQIKENINKLCFKYNGNLVNEELKYEEEINGKDKELNIMNIIIEEENKRELN